jgi:hypothetical protein
VGQSWKLYIDNNSGTYAPNKADLPCLEACIRQNFPDLDVEAVDRDDPRLADIKRIYYFLFFCFFKWNSPRLLCFLTFYRQMC